MWRARSGEWRMGLLLTLLLLWAGVAVRSPLLMGYAFVLLAVGLVGRFRRAESFIQSGQVQAVLCLGACATLAFSPEPPRTWWVASVFGLAAGWAGGIRLWRVLGIVGALAGMGVWELGMRGLGEVASASSTSMLFGLADYALRIGVLIAGTFLIGRTTSQQEAFQPQQGIEPVPLENLPHPRFLPQRLSLYLQQHLARAQAEGAVLYLYDLRAGTLDAVLRLGALPDLIKQRARVSMGDGMVGVCASTGKPLAFLSLLKPPADLPRNVAWEGAPSLCVPLFDPSSPSGRPLGVLQLVGSQLSMDSLPIAQALAARLAEALATVRHREAEQLANFQKLSAIVAQVEEQSPHTRGHSHRVAAIADLLAQELGLEQEVRDKLRIAALFHDIGKTRVPPEILNKEGALTDEEKLQIRRYPIYSVEICSSMGFDEDVLFLIRHHGERLDGSGYPDGLDATRQPLALRILQVADVFDTMACTRAYRDALSTEERLRELSRLAGTKLDILVVETLRRAHLQGRLEPIYNELLRHPLGQEPYPMAA
ncbi:MAG: HD domain-containing phosphohydrolase [Armatimonadota bacterium]